MTSLKNYLNDGANHQAKAVLSFLQGDGNVYELQINAARWENCREQGYILFMRSQDYSRQLNIAFFEHRNMDEICAVKWEQNSTNSLTIDTAEFGDMYKDKYDVSFSVGYGQIKKMADWISKQFVKFSNETNKKQ